MSERWKKEAEAAYGEFMRGVDKSDPILLQFLSFMVEGITAGLTLFSTLAATRGMKKGAAMASCFRALQHVGRLATFLAEHHNKTSKGEGWIDPDTLTYHDLKVETAKGELLN